MVMVLVLVMVMVVVMGVTVVAVEKVTEGKVMTEVVVVMYILFVNMLYLQPHHWCDNYYMYRIQMRS
jgi:hypothetical protein